MTKRESPKKLHHLVPLEPATLRAVWGGGAVKAGTTTTTSTQKADNNVNVNTNTGGL